MRHLAKFFALAAVAASLTPAIATAERSWTGPYAGGNVGMGISNGSVEDKDCWFCASDSFHERLFQAGVHAGYNKQITSTVLGGEAELTYGTQHHTGMINQHQGAEAGTNASDYSTLSWTLAALGRVGMAVQDNLIYLAAGPSISRISGSVVPLQPGTPYTYTQAYWQPGMKTAVGIEHYVSDKLSARAQYSMLFVSDRIAWQAPDVANSSRIAWLNQQYLVSVGFDWHF